MNLICSICKEEKSWELFRLRGKNTQKPICTNCFPIYESIRQQKDAEKARGVKKRRRINHPEIKSKYNRASTMEKTYGITQNEYTIILNRQGGVCAICGGGNKNGRELYIDHDHNTGRVRGLLCTKCNSALGFIEDRIEVAKKLIDYLVAASTGGG